MPRQGVPYPSREICSLKCQIDALNAKINELMKSINGVQGDGQGDLSLVSGDPAIVINNDASQNQIEIALDQSQLPAAAVSSVNSQTGAVVLEADDIPSDGNSDVQADIDALKALGVNLQGAINNEVTARGNADAALQGNINTLQASIPGEAANAVANDPTVQGLVTADAQNVKLGGSQNITGVKTVPTEATGSATQQIANGAKVKNELDAYAPMVRTTGNQTKAGTLTALSTIQGMASYGNGEASSALPVGKYCNLIRVARANISTFRGVAVLFCWQRANGSNLDILMVQFHLTNAGGLVAYNLGSPIVDYYVSGDDDYVYIGIKSKYPTLAAGSRQMRMVTQQGFNQYVEFQPYNTGEISAPPGTLIQETNL